ncbi:MFS transporter [Rothia halotolerans]|uniref:MFS transporter n=1 Tax=Rothia halotolerans TaxID=405770 RepID=UPI001EE094D1|nr:MFS transporter [Rothia halotolerans]
MSIIDKTPVRRPSARSTFAVSGFGTAMEYYDFSIYGHAAALVFPVVFFPDLDPLTGTLVAFLTFGAGFLSRPLGGLIVGHFGDKLGRRPMLIMTLTTMGVCTVLIGCLPTSSTIGAAAPILLVLLRIVQGMAAGGEWGGAALFGMENAPEGRRGLWGSFTSVGISLGTLLGVVVFTVLSAVAGDALIGGAWRIAFWLGGALVILGLVMRLRMPQEETPAAAEEAPKLPILDALRARPRAFLCAVGVSFGYITLAYVTSTFMLTYMTSIGYGEFDNLMISLVGAVALLFGAPLFAALSDRWGRRPVLIVGSLLIALGYWAYFVVVGTHSLPGAYAVTIITGVLVGSTQGPIPAFLGEQFPRASRYSAISGTYQIGAALGGASAASVATWLLIAFDGHWAGVMLYLVAALALLALCTAGMRETARVPLEELDERP